ncbi:hypothetical protein [Bradyrhizobium sp. 200]|uniref:hypothetical protein n=1 Tax=Bradyrhizobium sp. 200 TaxID=2782665 RepID=UPI001FFFE6B5|nr:hypothetical protein [Bradyrhizobium sp. 200]
MAKRSAILLVRWKVIDAFPKVAAMLAAVHWGRCTRFALPHASSITRETPGVVARILPMSESKVLRRPDANYAPMLRSCNGSRQHFLRLLRARHVERAASMTSDFRHSTSAVIPREGGVSSTPQLLDALRASLEYWITRG